MHILKDGLVGYYYTNQFNINVRLEKSLVGGRPTWHKEPIHFLNKMLTLRATANHVVLHCSIYACVISQMFLFHFIFYGGALVFL